MSRVRRRTRHAPSDTSLTGCRSDSILMARDTCFCISSHGACRSTSGRSSSGTRNCCERCRPGPSGSWCRRIWRRRARRSQPPAVRNWRLRCALPLWTNCVGSSRSSGAWHGQRRLAKRGSGPLRASPARLQRAPLPPAVSRVDCRRRSGSGRALLAGPSRRDRRGRGGESSASCWPARTFISLPW